MYVWRWGRNNFVTYTGLRGGKPRGRSFCLSGCNRFLERAGEQLRCVLLSWWGIEGVYWWFVAVQQWGRS